MAADRMKIHVCELQSGEGHAFLVVDGWALENRFDRPADQAKELHLAIGEFFFEFSQLEFTIRHLLASIIEIDDKNFDTSSHRMTLQHCASL